MMDDETRRKLEKLRNGCDIVMIVCGTITVVGLIALLVIYLKGG